MANDLGFIDPTYSGSNGKIAMASRPNNLTGKVIGLLDNTKEQAGFILKTIGDELIERYGAARTFVRRKEHYSKPAHNDLIDEMAKQAQIVVCCLGG